MSKKQNAAQPLPEEGANKTEDAQFPIVKYGKVLVFLLLVIIEIIFAVSNRQYYYWIVPAAIVLTTENAIKIWGLKSYKPKIACYVLDVLILLVLTYFSDGNLISTLYIIILSEFYLTQKKLAGSIAMCVCDICLFLITLAVSSALKNDTVDIGAVIINAVNDLFLFSLHFLIMNFAIQIYRKNKELAHTLSDLNESNGKLQSAYAELQRVTVLEERQRIAKEIHDTAGHSMTTVIMQTEAAKLLVESDPTEAKKRISAANLQAKRALEELRENVHVLSGIGGRDTLKSELSRIIHDSTDGTDIAVRSDIDDISLCDAKARFLCNTLKEGISNGLRHGGATAFYFELKEQDGRVEFLLSDNGAGMEIAQLKEGFGLNGMHSRAESLGGNVWFETEPDEGFEIHMILPSDGRK